ncbi:MAG: DivIVA domain-containing protein [Ruminococcus sp.]|nr:DivIVA domain-containing protein [Ruminococcus sp.]
MLTIDEIKEVSFRRSGRSGYNAVDVDEFIDEIVDTVEKLTAEKAELLRKMDILATKIEQYRTEEETVRNALLQSQKVSDTTIKDAKNKASYIIKSAEKKSRSILTEAEMATEREKDKFEALHMETVKLKDDLMAIYKKHLEVIKELPSAEDVAKKRKELDEKYPFEPVDDIINADDINIEEEMMQAAMPPVEEPDEDITIRRPVKEQKNDKFDQLKFGDNYDVE